MKSKKGNTQSGSDQKKPAGFWEDFSKKAAWFTSLRRLPLGQTYESLYAEGIQQSQRMKEHIYTEPEMQLKGPVKTPVLAIGKDVKAKLTKTKNPFPGGAVTFASDCYKLIGNGDFTHTVIYLPFTDSGRKETFNYTVRVFRYSESSGLWEIVPRSGFSPVGDAAWAEIQSPGIYVAVALPVDMEKAKVLTWLFLNKGYILDAEKKSERTARVKELLKQIGGVGILKPALNPNQDVQQKKFMSGGGGGLPGGGFAEYDILDDICPPWFGRRPFGPWGIPFDPRDFQFPGGFGGFGGFRIRDWVSMGPINVSGRIKSIAMHPANSSILYAGAANGGIWKTTNGGDSWQALWFTEQTMSLGSIAICRDSPNVIYAGTGEDNPGWNLFPGNGIYKSIDDGNSWSLTGTGPGQFCSRVLAHPTDANVAWAGTNAGVFKTTDGGVRWNLMQIGYVSDMVMDPMAPDTVYVALWNQGIRKTTDGGTRWEDANGSWGFRYRPGGWIERTWEGIPTGTDADWIKLDIGRNGTGGSQFLVAKLGFEGRSVYTTGNGGTTWTRAAANVAAVSYHRWTSLVAVNPNDHRNLFTGSVGLFRASDARTFVGTSGTHADHHQLIFDPRNPTHCFVCTDGGIYKSTDSGQSWVERSRRLIATQLYSIGVSQAGTRRVGCSTQDQGVIYTTGSTQWNWWPGNEGGFVVIDPNNSDNIYICPWDSNLLRTTGGHAGTFTSILNGMTTTFIGVTTPAAGVAHVAVRPGSSNQLLAAGTIDIFSGASRVFRSSNVYRSATQGDLWVSVLNSSTDAFNFVHFSPFNNQVCYASSDGGRLFRSATAGSLGSWAEPYTAANRPPAASISCIAAGWANENLVAISYGGFDNNRLFLSTDGGGTWNNISGANPMTRLPMVPVTSIVWDQFNDQTMYVSTDVGIFRTRNRGVDWENFNDGMGIDDVPTVIVSQLALRRSTNTLYASTMGRGSYSRTL